MDILVVVNDDSPAGFTNSGKSFTSIENAIAFLEGFRSIEDENAQFVEEQRIEYIRQNIMPKIEEAFEKDPGLKSAAVGVAQYWDDEAADAVHARVYMSVLDEVDWDAAVSEEWDYYEGDDKDPNLPGYVSMYSDPGKLPGAKHYPDTWVRWDDNNEAIPLFACYAPEGGDQSAPTSENYNLYCQINRDGEIKVVGEMLRPWLDGTPSNWSLDYN